MTLLSLVSSCGPFPDTDRQIEIASRSDQAEIASYIFAQFKLDKSEPIQMFCVGKNFQPPFPTFKEDMNDAQMQKAPNAEWFSDTAANIAYRNLMASEKIVEFANRDAIPLPTLRPTYPSCPKDISVPLDEEGLFYKYRTVDLSLPVRSGDFVFLEVASYCGPLCASGNLLALRRNDAGKWIVVERLGLWIS